MPTVTSSSAEKPTRKVVKARGAQTQGASVAWVPMQLGPSTLVTPLGLTKGDFYLTAAYIGPHERYCWLFLLGIP